MTQASAHVILHLLQVDPKIRAVDLWQKLQGIYGSFTIRELDDTITKMRTVGTLPADFVLRGLRHCPVCSDGNGRYHAFVRRQDKIAHMKDHAKHFPGTLPRFEARLQARERRRLAALDNNNRRSSA